jgi:lysophospholipase L1-like esterase
MSARSFLCVISLALACACGAAVQRRPLPENALRPSAPRLIGRFETSDPAGPRFAWSASTIEARFRGVGIAMRLRASPPASGGAGEKTVPYTVRVDDKPDVTIDVSPGRELYELASALGANDVHLVRITREAEAFAGVHQLIGFELPPGAELLPPRPPPKLRIEVLGDSITCGYGVLGKDRSCPFSFATERASRAYAALAADALGADLVTVCWSGRGVYRNYSEEGPLALDLFEKVAPPLDAIDKHESPPDVFVVNLGTNDLFSPAGAFDPAAFEKGYRKILARVREVYPKTPIFAAVPAMLEGERRKLAKAGIERAIQGANDVTLVVFSEQGEKVGCDGHPNAEMQKINAEELVAAVQRVLAP